MNKDMLDLCGWVIDQAKKVGADGCKAALNRTRAVDVSYRERKPENIKEATSQTLSLTLYVDGRYSSQSTSDLRKDALTGFISQSAATTRLIAKDPYRSLPDPKYYQGRANLDLQVLDPAHQKLTPEKRHEIVKTMEGACLEAGGVSVISVEAGSSDQFSQQSALTSNGFEGYQESTRYSLFASMTAKDEGDRRPSSYEYAATRLLSALPSPETIGRNAAQRTLAMRGAKKIKTETLPIIIQNRDVGAILYGLFNAMTSFNIQQKRSCLADKKDQRIGSDVLTLIDDPHLAGGLGSALFDGEGMSTRKRVFVDAGVLKDYYVDWYYGRKLGWEPTIGSPTNLVIPPGKRTVAQVMKDLGRGILINSFIGGNSNSTTGDFSIGIGGFLFENGVKTQTVAEMNIADNHLNFWTKLVEAADDPWAYGNWRTPSLIFKDVVVSGL
jgi:PmbA protein